MSKKSLANFYTIFNKKNKQDFFDIQYIRLGRNLLVSHMANDSILIFSVLIPKISTPNKKKGNLVSGLFLYVLEHELYIVSYIKWVKTSWTYSKLVHRFFGLEFAKLTSV